MNDDRKFERLSSLKSDQLFSESSIVSDTEYQGIGPLTITITRSPSCSSFEKSPPTTTSSNYFNFKFKQSTSTTTGILNRPRLTQQNDFLSRNDMGYEHEVDEDAAWNSDASIIATESDLNHLSVPKSSQINEYDDDNSMSSADDDSLSALSELDDDELDDHAVSSSDDDDDEYANLELDENGNKSPFCMQSKTLSISDSVMAMIGQNDQDFGYEDDEDQNHVTFDKEFGHRLSLDNFGDDEDYSGSDEMDLERCKLIMRHSLLKAKDIQNGTRSCSQSDNEQEEEEEEKRQTIKVDGILVRRQFSTETQEVVLSDSVDIDDDDDDDEEEEEYDQYLYQQSVINQRRKFIRNVSRSVPVNDKMGILMRRQSSAQSSCGFDEYEDEEMFDPKDDGFDSPKSSLQKVEENRKFLQIPINLCHPMNSQMMAAVSVTPTMSSDDCELQSDDHTELRMRWDEDSEALETRSNLIDQHYNIIHTNSM